jgi:cardiolipin synthase
MTALWHGQFNTLLSLHGVFTVAALLTYVGVTRALHQRRYPAAAIGWVTVLLLLPYVALPLFLVFGTRKLARNAHPGSAASRETLRVLPWPQALAASMDLKPAASYNGLSVHANGAEALAALHAVIASATHTLDICTFIVGNDALGSDILDALARKAQAGVRVRFLLDGVGRWLGGRPDLSRLTHAGVEVAIFVPLLHSPSRGRVNLRNHRKLAIADNRRLWAGGRNLASEYFMGSLGHPPWHDLTFDFDGELVDAGSALFAHDWAFATNHRAPTHLTQHTVVTPARDAAAAAQAQVVPTGPDQAYDTVLSMLVTACFRAQQRILAVTPYFVPDESLLGALLLAARRGVVVDLVLPAHSNHRMADIARHRALRDLVHSGARVWLLPQMIHAKGFVADDTIAFVGSANLDSRSLFLNYELMVAFYRGDDVRRFAAWIEGQRAQCTPYAAHPPGLLRDVAEGMILGFAFQI